MLNPNTINKKLPIHDDKTNKNIAANCCYASKIINVHLWIICSLECDAMFLQRKIDHCIDNIF